MFGYDQTVAIFVCDDDDDVTVPGLLNDGSTAAHIIKTHPPFSIYKYVRPHNVPPYIFVNTNLTQSILIST